MKKIKILGYAILVVLLLFCLFSFFKYLRTGNQIISVNVPSSVFSNSPLIVRVLTFPNKGDVPIESNKKVELLDLNKKVVKGIKTSYDNDIVTMNIPDIEPGDYILRTHVSSRLGSDDVLSTISFKKSNLENIIVHFDKGIYKPGDKVQFRALILAKGSGVPKDNKKVTIVIKDGNGNRVYNETTNTSNYGIVSGTFKLANEVNSGTYELSVSTEYSSRVEHFIVNPYVLPKYEVTLSTDKEQYLIGDTVHVDALATYFFGEPVSNASVTFYYDDKTETTRTDENGKALFTFKPSREKVYSIKAEVVDNSNYYIESSTTIFAGESKYQIEAYPEFGKLIKGTKNNMYVFTKTVYNEPIKTYLTITAGQFKKQVVTDENGVGVFSIDIDSSDSSNKQVRIDAETMDGEKFSKVFSFLTQNESFLIKTDKIKYKYGEDINLEIVSEQDNYEVAFCKGSKIIKILNTESANTSVNLEDECGLIDIYQVLNGQGDLEYKRTIFVAPEKGLNIKVDTDKTEYKPGDKINISFNVQDENGSDIDAALLVSMLDNSVLKLADNDLSIDNIRLALQDSNLDEGIDLASLYSSIINDANEPLFMTLLLKQGGKTVGFNKLTIQNTREKNDYYNKFINSLVVLVVCVICVLLFKFMKAKDIINDICNYLVLTGILLFVYLVIINDIFYYEFDFSWLFVLGIAIVSLILYIVFINKERREYISKTSKYILLTCALTFVIIYFIAQYYKAGGYILLGILGFALIVVIIDKLCKIGKITNSYIHKFTQVIVDYLKFLVVLIAVWLLTFIVSMVFYAITKNILYSLDEFGSLLQLILNTLFFVVALYFLYNYYQNGALEESSSNRKGKGITIAVLLGIAIIVLLLLSLGALLYNASSDMASSSSMSSYSGHSIPNTSSYNSSNSRLPELNVSYSAPTESVQKASSGFDFNFSLPSFSSVDRDNNSNDNYIQSSTENLDNLTTEEVNDHVRSVFLESMCFVPELIAENGLGKLNLNLSDNITTWTIQAVGNTKDGRIGHGAKNDVKVFKEFFVDFDFPANLVVGDKISIPVTIYNYTQNELSVNLKVVSSNWFTLEGSNNLAEAVLPNSTKMVYVPIQVLSAGNNIFRIESSSEVFSDIVEKQVDVSFNGYKVEKVITSGVLDQDISDDILLLDNMIDNSSKVNVKIYTNATSQTIEGVENIFRMPTGCFEQVSSSLYPDIVALRYLRNNNIEYPELEKKVLEYISSGYQKLLAYEVGNKSGGFSLYGHEPAETVLTAYGLMEFKDLSTVYDVDENLITRTTEFLYGKQKSDGSFNIQGHHLGGAGSREEIALNSYIIWALTEANPKDYRLNKSIEYIKSHIEKTSDNYTLGLIACSLANVEDGKAKEVANKLINNLEKNNNNYYLKTTSRDYYGSYGMTQDLQATSLLSMALSKLNMNQDTNKNLINYIASKKDNYGTWYSTQSTILCLKAINSFSIKKDMPNQTIKVTFNADTRVLDIKDNSTDFISFTFENPIKENKLDIDIEKGEAMYMVSEEHYIPYEEVDTKENKFDISLSGSLSTTVNGVIEPTVRIINNSNNEVYNGMVVVNIPQGFVILEESLQKLQSEGLIEKYEMNYRTINLYLRDFEDRNIINLPVKFRASYPVDVMGLSIKAYDYYNPDVEGILLPQRIVVK